jgi:hypothetical protein
MLRSNYSALATCFGILNAIFRPFSCFKIQLKQLDTIAVHMHRLWDPTALQYLVKLYKVEVHT